MYHRNTPSFHLIVITILYEFWALIFAMAHMNASVLVGANAGPDMKDQIIPVEQEAEIHRLTAQLRESSEISTSIVISETCSILVAATSVRRRWRRLISFSHFEPDKMDIYYIAY